MDSFDSSFRFCRVCLIPEDDEKFVSIFADGGKTVSYIYKLIGITLFDVEPKIPSLVCGKCTRDLITVEKLKARMLDANEYYNKMTSTVEKSLVKENLLKLQRKDLQSKRLSIAKKDSDSVIKVESFNENRNPKKRPRETDDVETLEKSTPKATPNKLGIERMIIKNKRTSTERPIESYFEPMLKTPPSKKKVKKSKKKTFRPRLNLKRKSGEGEKKITFECDNCKETFGTYSELNDHLATHDFDEPFQCEFCELKFANEEYRDVHVKARHLGQEDLFALAEKQLLLKEENQTKTETAVATS